MAQDVSQSGGYSLTKLDDPGGPGVIYHSPNGGRKLVLTVPFCYSEETSSSLLSSNLVQDEIVCTTG